MKRLSARPADHTHLPVSVRPAVLRSAEQPSPIDTVFPTVVYYPGDRVHAGRPQTSKDIVG